VFVTGIMGHSASKTSSRDGAEMERAGP